MERLYKEVIGEAMKPLDNLFIQSFDTDYHKTKELYNDFLSSLDLNSADAPLTLEALREIKFRCLMFAEHEIHLIPSEIYSIMNFIYNKYDDLNLRKYEGEFRDVAKKEGIAQNYNYLILLMPVLERIGLIYNEKGICRLKNDYAIKALEKKYFIKRESDVEYRERMLHSDASRSCRRQDTFNERYNIWKSVEGEYIDLCLEERKEKAEMLKRFITEDGFSEEFAIYLDKVYNDNRHKF